MSPVGPSCLRAPFAEMETTGGTGTVTRNGGTQAGRYPRPVPPSPIWAAVAEAIAVRGACRCRGWWVRWVCGVVRGCWRVGRRVDTGQDWEIAKLGKVGVWGREIGSRGDDNGMGSFLLSV